ncbi:MAG: PilW family protein [Woeseiaceae bacterium]|nr:PilW family protein [Woeseiaceae bacterium]
MMMAMNRHTHTRFAPQHGMTLVELMVALAIGSFLIIGAVQVYNQSRQAFVVNESIARVQETAQFAMDTIEADLRMASNWGRHSRASAVEGRSLQGDANPLGLAAPVVCGDDWALDLGSPVEGDNNAYNLACAANNGAQANSDTVTTRRASVARTALGNRLLQIQSTRVQGQIFDDGTVPPAFDATCITPPGTPLPPDCSATHDLLVSTYYVSADSDLIPSLGGVNTPTLRRKTLMGDGSIDDIEVAPGVENLQLQFGVDVDEDNTVDRYVNPADGILTPGNANFIPTARVITARIWLVVRSVSPEPGIDDQRNYQPGDVNLGVPADEFRRLQVSKTILLRNARS